MTSPDPEPLWLRVEAGPDLGELANRIAYWEGLERAWLRHAPAGLRWGATPTARPPAPHELCERWFPLATLRDELTWLLEQWFGADLRELGVNLAASSLGRARSWLDARAQLSSLGERRLPAALIRRLAAPASAHALLFELFAPPQLGRGLTRYPERLALLVELLEPADRTLRVWDAGCALGESTWAIAIALTQAGAQVEAVGTTPWPLERLMAERGALPHDAARTALLQAAITSAPPACAVRFELGDLAHSSPLGPFDLVCCHGVLGGVISEAEGFEQATRRLAESLAPGGLLSVHDAFRPDLSADALSRVRDELGWEEVGAGVFRAPEPLKC
ncbi:MAG: hypothetical protein JKY65_09130 [Planctomycetes bacterium]|nr:hypothetical protein [Planctomycetota bacterium]